MLNLKKLLTKILNFLCPQTTTVYGNFSSDIHLQKRCGVVTLTVIQSAVTALSVGWNDIATIPAGYRPLTQLNLIGVDNNALTAAQLPLVIRLFQDGKLQVYKCGDNTTNNQIFTSFTYVAAD